MGRPASDATEYCPAVAALVMSKPNNPSFYRSAARLQPATKMHAQAYDNENLPADACKSPTAKTLYQPEILELKATLRSMFRAWKKDRDESSKADWSNKPRVVFYRDSYHEIDPLTHEREVEHITEAYQNVFTKTEDPPLSYVTVMRNSRVHSPIPEDKQDKDDVCTPHFTFTTSEFAMGDPTRKEDGAKYQYLVHSNGDKSKMTLGKLRDLTGLLNISSQLCHYTSLALPVNYARKLARRVLSYYDYVSHKDISNYPGLAKLTPYDAVTGREQMNEVKQNLQVIAKRSKPWDWVRDNKKEAHIRPWNKKLDDKMFFL
ncbi:hypothetical protein SLS60_001457 [Paraconiothyrium brasiliense]|uniref:Uncharacterized protein n=1 Tax=Paraconiothyrium brasiliense TaxID=300254 RepID=A0ABR3S947_9PLEO